MTSGFGFVNPESTQLREHGMIPEMGFSRGGQLLVLRVNASVGGHMRYIGSVKIRSCKHSKRDRV